MLNRLFPDDVVTATATPRMWDAPISPHEAPAIAGAARKRRRDYAAGRACARLALRRLGITGVSLPSDADGVPVWPRGVVGSLAHCNGFCAAALSSAPHIRSVGLDAEPAGPLPKDVRQFICSQRETDWIAGQPPDTHGNWYKILFCAKESAFKAVFSLTRRPFDFWDLEVEFLPDSNRFSIGRAPALPSARLGVIGRFAQTGTHVLAGVTIANRNRDEI